MSFAHFLGAVLAFSTLLQPSFAKDRTNSSLQRFEAKGRHMGVIFKIVLYARDETSAKKAFAAAFHRVDELNDSMSDYERDSELSRLSRSSPTQSPIKVSDDLWRVLTQAQTLSRRSNAAFDITVGPFTRLWRQARRLKRMPDPQRLQDAKQAVGYQHLVLEMRSKSVSLRRANMRLDLGGIAKGYAADEALAVLRSLGITRAFIDASGDIRLGDPPPGEKGWRIGVAPLKADAPPSRILSLANCAVATSGDAWQHVEIDGIRYSHIVNPLTGLGLTDRSSVTVVAPDCTTADALASAVSVLGPKRGIALVEQTPKTAALVVRAPKETVEIHKSKGFDAYLAEMKK